LSRQIGACVEQYPTLAICTHRQRSLGAWLYSRIAGPRAAAIFTATIPLWEAAACRSPQNFYMHA
jgi:hypothetical protein